MSTRLRTLGCLVSLSLLAACAGESYEETLARPSGSAAPARKMALHSAIGRTALAVESEPAGNTEAYARVDHNPFLATDTDPLSTFSVDVDTASYSNVRRFLLADGALPPPDAVRIEEMVNYFSYAYPDAPAGQPFSVDTEVASCPWNDAHRLVRIGLQGRSMPAESVPPRNLVFLLDVSGSMQSANKLPLVKKGMNLLADQMRPQDSVAIVVYAGAAGLVLPPTDGNDIAAVRAAIENLSAGGSTNGGEGIRLAYGTARENFREGGINRVILATDGDFNVGVTDDGQLTRLIEEERESGVFLTVLGFGSGNLKDAKMEQLADRGNGNYAYIDNATEAKKVLVREAGGTLVTIAKDVKIQVEFNPTHVAAYRLLGYENRLLAARDFNDDEKDAGEIGAGHSVTALYEVVPPEAARDLPGTDPLRYQTPGHPTREASSDELLTVKLRYKEPDGDTSRLISQVVTDEDAHWRTASTDFRFATAVAGFGMLLRGDEHAGSASWDSVRTMGRDALGQDEHGYRAEFLTLVTKASELAAARDDSGTR